MQIYQVNNEFYQNWDQAYLNAEKHGVKVVEVDVIECDEIEVNYLDDPKIVFDNGDEFNIYFEFEDEINFGGGLDPENCDPWNEKYVDGIYVCLGNKRSIKIKENGYNAKNNLTPELIKEIERVSEIYLGREIEAENFE